MHNSNKTPCFHSRERGFTLIEVLVASFILFLVITAITMIYRGALLSSNKAERTLLFVSYVEPISEQIRSEIQLSVNQSELDGQGTMGKLAYRWSAKVTIKGNAPEQFSVETNELESGTKIFSLWKVSLELQAGNTIRNYEFSEISW